MTPRSGTLVGHPNLSELSGRAGGTQTARFLSLRRSRSDRPPQMPKRSSFISAYSRQSSRTSQVRQTFLASRVDPPFSGKNASGSVCAHRARSCHPASSVSGSRRNSSLTAFALSTRCCSHIPEPERHSVSRITAPRLANDTVGITCLSYPESQPWIWYGCLLPDRRLVVHLHPSADSGRT